MVLYTVYDYGEKVAQNVTSKEVAQITGIDKSNISDYAQSGHIKAGRYQICYSYEEVTPKRVSHYTNNAFNAVIAWDWDRTVRLFRNVQWGAEGRKLKVSKKK